jgi:predicted dehydrogenase
LGYYIQENKRDRLVYGMVGGAVGSFMGDIHRKAANFDGSAELVSGCFSRNWDKNLDTGYQAQVERVYKDFQEMAAEEAGKIDFVSIILPNYAHYEAARAFLEKGINVYCEKPLTFTVEEAEELVRLTREKELLFGVNYSYSGYPMVKQAREMIRNGEIGEIHMVMGEYPQGYLLADLAGAEGGISTWRVDPEIAGRSNCVGDIGSHIEHTVSYMTGLEIDSLSASLQSYAGASELDDNAEIMLKFKNGASGIYWSSQVAIGHDNGLKIRIYGSKGSIFWEQENPAYLILNHLDSSREVLSQGRDELYPLAAELVRLPAGHPEGLPSVFANMYKNFTAAVKAWKRGEYRPGDFDFPTVEDGLRGVKFINACVDSAEEDSSWVKL